MIPSRVPGNGYRSQFTVVPESLSPNMYEPPMNGTLMGIRFTGSEAIEARLRKHAVKLPN